MSPLLQHPVIVINLNKKNRQLSRTFIEYRYVERGYTLFEILIVLALSTLLLGISLPTFNKLGRDRAKSDALSIASLLTRGKNLALLNDAPYYVQFLPNNAVLVSSRSQTIARVTVQSTVSKERQVNPSVTFYSSGVASPLTLTVQHHTSICHVVVTLRGRARASCR